MTTLNLPKGYLSHSSVSTWLRSRKQFRELYYPPTKSLYETKEISFGKKTGKEYEMLHTEESWPVSNDVIRRIPRHTAAEQELLFTLGEVPFKGYIDSFCPKTGSIIELKTGRKTSPWNQARVNRHDQLVAYVIGVKALFGEANPYVKLIWLPTHDVETSGSIDGVEFSTKELALTGEHHIFSRCVQLSDITEYTKKVENVAREISEDYTMYKRLKGLE